MLNLWWRCDHGRIHDQEVESARYFREAKAGKPALSPQREEVEPNHPRLECRCAQAGSRLCGPCNNTRSQPYDRAWEAFSWFARTRLPPIRPGDFIRADGIYPMSLNLGLRYVQLYFVKLFGRFIDENKIRSIQSRSRRPSSAANTVVTSSFGSDVYHAPLENSLLGFSALQLRPTTRPARSKARSGSTNWTGLR